MPQYAVGVDLGGTNLKVALVDSDGALIRRATASTDADAGPHAVMDRIAGAIERVVAGLPDGAEIAGVGIGAPGSVSMDRTTISKPPNFRGWDSVHIPDELTGRLRKTDAWARFGGDARFLAENDANVAGLGSAFWGAGAPYDSFVMVTLGTGVGGAIIHDKRLFRGISGAAGEIGHMTLDYEGPYARSGVAGAAEAYLGHRFLSRHARYQLLVRDTNLHESTGPDLCDLDPVKMHRAAVAGDTGAREVFAWAGHKLGVLMGSIVNLLDIRTFVVGGGLSNAGAYLLDPARATIGRYVTPAMNEGLEVIREARGNDVAFLGAARLVFEALEDDA